MYMPNERWRYTVTQFLIGGAHVYTEWTPSNQHDLPMSRVWDREHCGWFSPKSEYTKMANFGYTKFISKCLLIMVVILFIPALTHSYPGVPDSLIIHTVRKNARFSFICCNMYSVKQTFCYYFLRKFYQCSISFCSTIWITTTYDNTNNMILIHVLIITNNTWFPHTQLISKSNLM